jgi:hypothetical protein
MQLSLHGVRSFVWRNHDAGENRRCRSGETEVAPKPFRSSVGGEAQVRTGDAP